MCFVGQQLVFEEACTVVNSLTGSSFNAKQIERVCHMYGGMLEQETSEHLMQGDFLEHKEQDREALHYVMVDGAMYPTREKGEPWREVKLGRVIKADQILPLCKDRNFIDNSIYVAHLGSSKEFFPRLEYEIEGLKNLAIVSDGAKWIWNWAEDLYPNSIQILDYFHAKEHLCDFAKESISDEDHRKAWVELQSTALLEQQPEVVIQAIRELPQLAKDMEIKREQLLNYYGENINRMRYSTFKKKGLFIGSGAIESAHKSVLQERMKRSGQHWSLDGLQQIAQLRTVYKSKRWLKIENFAKNAA
jgi:hypothetical protein